MLRMYLLTASMGLMCLSSSYAQGVERLEIPRRHDRPPGPPLSPEEAVRKMTVPEGFTVEIVAAEPDVMNPVGMFIDEKGRYWITESFEYPRREPGPGRDRVKVLEDTDGDGAVDKTTVFAEGLNIPSGIAVGHGGVWVANAPDLLFLQDTDGDLQADTSEVVVTGFGRTDTHELPNSLTWGPDGWLYGLNGVFNYSHVNYPQANPNYEADHPGWEFTCALFRIHPRTRKFEVFAEGTSNPWGVAVNDSGDFFLSACVIDHLWHITQTGYYIRQGGPYPPHTWPIGSIVEHKHQKAAYCGITWLDSDAYPEEYRNVLYMGNIHGGCINADIADPAGATYHGRPHPGFPAKPGAWDNDEYGLIRKTGDPQNPKLADFLTANDAWFMPVVQKVGPDGSLYVLDWYDRYHCYQDANADPEGIERSRGRLYRVRYDGTPRVAPFDLSLKTDEELIELLGHANVYYRQTARRLLTERNQPELVSRLLELALAEGTPEKQRRNAVFALVGCDLPDMRWMEVAERLAQTDDPFLTTWAIRCLINHGIPSISSNDGGAEYELRVGEIIANILDYDDFSLPTKLQAVIYIGLLSQQMPSYLRFGESLGRTTAENDDDPLVAKIVWPNLRAYLDHESHFLASAADFVTAEGVRQSRGGREITKRLLQWLPEREKLRPEDYGTLLAAALDAEHGSPELAAEVLQLVSGQLQTGQLRGPLADTARETLAPVAEKRLESAPGTPGRMEAAMLLARAGNGNAVELLRGHARDGQGWDGRMEALSTLIAINDAESLDIAAELLTRESSSNDFRAAVISTIAASSDPKIGTLLLDRYSTLHPAIQPKAIEVLTQRPVWSKPLLQRIAAEKIDKNALNVNQLLRLASSRDEALQRQLIELYGQIRTARSDRQGVINRMNDFLRGTPGDPFAGQKVFNKVCAQCHKMYGEGAEVGPDITRNGRNDWNQLLRNVLDPSQVIGPGYQARQALLADGRVLTGLAVEENEQRVVLKLQGGKLETISRDDIDEYKVSELSMMPEGLEKQVSPQELADLFAYLSLDRPPTDQQARLLNGAPAQKARP